jgi:hypothetical protein
MHQIQPERGNGWQNQNVIQLGILLLFLVIPIILFWRRDLFFILDDWSLLHLMVGNNLWVFSRMADGDVFMPVTRFIYYTLIHLFSVHYGWLILVNCLLTGLNGFLLYLIFKSHFKPNLALALSILYVVAAVHSATAQMAFYICAILCLGFFLLSLLFTQIYVRRPSNLSLLGIGLFAWLSVNSWNFSLLGIWTLPIYAALFWGTGAKRNLFWLTAVIGLVFLCFTAEYFIFNGLAGAKSHNPKLFSQFFSFSYFTHWAVGSFLAPLVFLLNIEYSRVAKVVMGLVIFISTVGLIMWAGNLSEKKLCLWALVVNALPFLLVSLARHHFHFGQAFSDRYGIFTIIGALLISGTTWQIIADKLPARLSTQVVLPLVILAVMIWGQVHTIPKTSRIYIELSHEAKSRYDNLRDDEVRAKLSVVAEKNRLFFNQNQPTPVHPFLNNGHAVSIYKYLSGLP